jgi:hypothetical protein
LDWTHHIFASGDEDKGTSDLGEDTHVDSRVGNDLTLDPESWLSSLQLRVGKLSADMEVTRRDRNRYNVQHQQGTTLVKGRR